MKCFRKINHINIAFVVALLVTFLLPSFSYGQDLIPIPESNQGVLPLAFIAENPFGDGAGGQLLIGNISSVIEDSKGYIFMSDTRVQCVYKFDTNGSLIEQFSETGDGPGDIATGARIAIDSLDRIFLGGQTGDVHVMDTSWNYLRGFQRENSGEMIRSIQITSDGSVLIGTLGIMDRTTIDLYSPDHFYQNSFAKTFAGEDEDWRYETAFAGGYFTLTSDEGLLYAQLSPFEIRRYSPDWELINSTSQGGDDFVPTPIKPDFSKKRIRIVRRWGVTGIVELADGSILTSSWRVFEDGETRSLFCVHNQDLELIAKTIFKNYHSVKGIDRAGKVFLCSKDDYSNRVFRAKVLVGVN